MREFESFSREGMAEMTKEPEVDWSSEAAKAAREIENQAMRIEANTEYQ